ncbi:MAG: hypothetical protein IAE82_18720 [Opitutaceae bacterium]|nr:hypothetical protein [Opitutaceae bacterium]
MTTGTRAFRPWLHRAIAAVVLLAIGHVVYVEDDPRHQPSSYVLEIQLATSASGSAQVFFDRGAGFRQEDSSSAAVAASSELRSMRFPLPLGPVRRLRLDYVNGADAAATLRDMRVIDAATGAVMRHIAAADLRPNDHIAAYRVDGDTVHVTARPGADDPHLVAALDPVLHLGPSGPARLRGRLPIYLGLVGVFVTLAWVIDAAGNRRQRRECAGRPGWLDGLNARPRLVITAAAVVATAACCHPVIFAGRSLVSPDYGVALLHPDHGDAGTDDRRIRANDHGSDTGAMFWQHLPYSVVQHRALAGEAALPLWNRYNSCGVALFGQGQSMLGDPLHLPVILAGGAAWAWDAKFVAARLLFALGVGLAAFAATRRLGPSALATVCAPFIGFFSYRLNHPAVITVCYSPWLLVAWLELARVREVRASGRWFVLLITANACVLTSGTVKEAAMLALVLNATGLLAVCFAPQARAVKTRLTGIALVLGLGGVLLAAPWWTAFAHTLASAWTAYDTPYAARIPIGRLAGLFDGLLYAEYTRERYVYAPSANFLVLLGVLLALLRWRALPGQRSAAALAAGLAVAISLAFDVPWIPDSWILAVPGLRSVGHLGNTFSCVALPLLAVLAAQGLAAAIEAVASDAADRRSTGRWRDALGIAVLAAVLVAPMLRDLTRTWTGASPGRGPASLWTDHGYLWLSLVGALVGWAVLGLALRRLEGRPKETGAGIMLLIAGLVPLLARHGQVLGDDYAAYFVRPGMRANLSAGSPALNWVRSTAGEPFRLVGLSGHVVAGFAAVHGIESPNGPDALAHRRYRELAEATGLAPTVDWYFPTERSDLATRRRILDALNVRFYATCDASAPAPDWMRPIHAADLAILESPSAWPRAFFVDRLATGATAADFVRLLEAGDGRPFAAVAPEDLQPGDAPAGVDLADRIVVPATDYRLTTQASEFSIAAPGPGLIVLLEAWQAGTCRITIDGAPAEMVRVNHAFAGLRIDRAGFHRIRFEACHPAPILALGLAAVGLVTLVFTLVGLCRHPVPPP